MGKCTYSFGKGEKSYYCKDCHGPVLEQTWRVFCGSCWYASDHKDHNRGIVTTNYGGRMCSCGNWSEIRKGENIYCNNHAPKVTVGLGVRQRTVIAGQQTMGGCTYTFKKGEKAYTCKDCHVPRNKDTSEMGLCGSCFNASDHKDHDWGLGTTIENRKCSCGNSSHIRKNIYCNNHAPKVTVGLGMRQRTVIAVTDEGILAARMRQLVVKTKIED